MTEIPSFPNPPIHLLLMAIVQEQDIETATTALEQIKAPIVHLAGTGGFLGRRNATLLIGLPDGMEEKVIEQLQKSCRRRIEYMTLPMEGSPVPLPAPIQVTVGGATIFALPVEYFEEF